MDAKVVNMNTMTGKGIEKDRIVDNMLKKKNKKEKVKKESEGASLIKKMAHDGAVGTKIMSHNGLIALVFIGAMVLLSIIMIDVAYAGVGLFVAYAGALNLETVADMLTIYTTILMICGFCLFAWSKVCNALLKAMKRRFWKKDYATGNIDKGDLWRERHPGNVA